jgi:hypothetical protein
MSEHEEFSTINSSYIDKYATFIKVPPVEPIAPLTHLDLSGIISSFEEVLLAQELRIAELEKTVGDLTQIINGRQFMNRTLSYESQDSFSEKKN